MNASEMQKLIFSKLMFAPSLKYSEIQKDITNHDLFNYHLKELVRKGFIVKAGSSYSLSEAGRQYTALMEEDGSYQKQYKVGMFVDVVRKNNGKWEYLLHKRLKHPHYGYIGAVTGKLRWGDDIETNLKRELKEEIGISVEHYHILGVTHELFLNDQNTVAGDGVFFVIVVDKWTGDPILKNDEGEYFWCEIDKILTLENIFRVGFEHGLPHLKNYLANPQKYTQFVIENITEPKRY